jgi:surface antigen
VAGKRRINHLTRIVQSKLEAVAAKPHLSRLTSTFQSRQGAVASALVAGAVATSALSIGIGAPTQATVAAAPITTLTEGGKAAKSLTGLGAEGADQVRADDSAIAWQDGDGDSTAKAVKAEHVITMAKSQVGTTEDGSGESKFGQWYASTERAKETMKRDGGSSTQDYEAAPWCAMFLAWTADQVGTDALGEDAYTVTYAQSFKDDGRWGTTPKPGAIVFFDWAGSKSLGGIDHVGLVSKVLDSGKVETVEGNISNSVISTVRTADIVGYGYPEYAE